MHTPFLCQTFFFYMNNEIYKTSASMYDNYSWMLIANTNRSDDQYQTNSDQVLGGAWLSKAPSLPI